MYIEKQVLQPGFNAKDPRMNMLVADKPTKTEKKKKEQDDIQAFGKSLKRGLLIDKVIVFTLLTVATVLAVYIGVMVF